MSKRYDIYFAGKIVAGFEEFTVRENVAALFKVNQKTLDRLFSGKPQAIKRGVDKQTAMKYKAVMEKAGAIAYIGEAAAPRAASPGPAAPPSDDAGRASPGRAAQARAAQGEAAEAQGGTLAERLAALTGDDSPDQRGHAADSATDEPVDESGLTLAPIGSEVLREDERQAAEARVVDISAISLSDPSDDSPLEAPAPPPPPPPDISHLSMGEVGDDIPHLENVVPLVNPDTSHLSLGAVGEAIPHLESRETPVNPDISGIELAPAGSDVLEEQYRRKETARAPNTDHLALA